MMRDINRKYTEMPVFQGYMAPVTSVQPSLDSKRSLCNNKQTARRFFFFFQLRSIFFGVAGMRRLRVGCGSEFRGCGSDAYTKSADVDRMRVIKQTIIRARF